MGSDCIQCRRRRRGAFCILEGSCLNLEILGFPIAANLNGEAIRRLQLRGTALRTYRISSITICELVSSWFVFSSLRIDELTIGFDCNTLTPLPKEFYHGDTNGIASDQRESILQNACRRGMGIPTRDNQRTKPVRR